MPEIKEPIDVTDLDIAFPASVVRLMPDYKEIPEEYRRGRTKWNELVSTWFFRGLKNVKYKPKEGIDQKKALRHLQTIMGSYEPKHEHKEAAVAYLLNQWFDDIAYEPGDLSKESQDIIDGLSKKVR